MIEVICITPIILLLIFLFDSKNKVEIKSSITLINDTNFIVDNKFISFDKDTTSNIYQQKSEDNRHYRFFEYNKLKEDRRYVSEIYFTVKRRILEYPGFLDLITIEKINENKGRYELYIKQCDFFKENALSIGEFTITRMSFSFLRIRGIDNILSTYTIYNSNTARYLKGNITEIMEQEFKEKNY